MAAPTCTKVQGSLSSKGISSVSHDIFDADAGRALARHVQQPDQLGGLPEEQPEDGAALLEAKLQGLGIAGLNAASRPPAGSDPTNMLGGSETTELPLVHAGYRPEIRPSCTGGN